ncbi:aminoglycoside phosphotransferase family protein [Deinococcus deserti]|uniref:Putative Phosphotransferase enzyme family protein n=1 Tax=Deinococcus deserti (strain DSM 17065 / CIP 109153 / LMG 22923 / VCD115) TaxID=546414 RepID=C1CWA4_DEIDV|nr:aminoglycoside phosphotransferase family protein [Deinococcus deserti]ACO46471.1 putative Phosphotransferase enzyme family protein [Deinococcus deserti VCD115]
MILVPPLAALHDAWAVIRGAGPAGTARVWPAELQAAFPGRRQLLEAWTGEGAAFVRYATTEGPLFLKYLPAGWRDQNAYRRLEREIRFLRDLAPVMPVDHAPLLHAALDRTRLRAHLLTPDLTAQTTGWGALTTDDQREAALHEIVRLLARLHAFWAGPGSVHLTGRWAWDPREVLTQAERIAAAVPSGHPAFFAVQAAAQALPVLLQDAPEVTLVHGDIHAGQVLWRVHDRQPVLIDYGQVHTSVPGEDLAHLLSVRLSSAERLRLGPALRETYRETLAVHGLGLSPSRLAAQERAGTGLNLLSTARQARQSSGSGVQEALGNVVQAWNELG